jgi:mersacidin/lichenicidin family type 2 lantibiotic
MSHQDIIRAWKDEEYRLSLSDADRKLLPQHTAGPIELTELEADLAAGGRLPKPTQVRVTCDQCQTQRYLTALTNCCVAIA